MSVDEQICVIDGIFAHLKHLLNMVIDLQSVSVKISSRLGSEVLRSNIYQFKLPSTSSSDRMSLLVASAVLSTEIISILPEP